MPFRGCLEGMCGGGRDLLNFTEHLGLLLLTTLSFSLWNCRRVSTSFLVIVLFAWLQVTAPQALKESPQPLPRLEDFFRRNNGTGTSF